MNKPIHSISANPEHYYLPSFQVPKSQTCKLLASTSSIFDRKFSKGSTIYSQNNGTTQCPPEDPSLMTQNDYFPNQIKTKKLNSITSKLKKINTFNKKMVSFQDKNASSFEPIDISSAVFYKNAQFVLHEPPSALIDEFHSAYLSDHSRPYPGMFHSTQSFEEKDFKTSLKNQKNSLMEKNTKKMGKSIDSHHNNKEKYKID